MANAIKQIFCLVVSAAIVAPGCATAGRPPIAPASIGSQDTAGRGALAEYVQQLSPGTLVRVDRMQGRSVHGTLIKATGLSIFVQPKTRVPEAVMEILVDDILAVTPEPKRDSSVGKAIGAGAAAGAAAALTIILILLAASGD